MPPNLEQWQYPIGRYQTKGVFLAEEINTSIAILKAFPSALKELLSRQLKVISGVEIINF